MEECGELIEACSKAIRCENYKDDRLTEEVGDVLYMIDLIIKQGLVDHSFVADPEINLASVMIKLARLSNGQ